jgi:hypothetical protein
MGRHRNARVVVLVRILRSEPTALGAIVEQALAAMGPLQSEAFETLSIHWNLPLRPLFDANHPPTEPGLSALAARISDGRDHVVPMGYCGALHPLLVREELEREITWMQDSPWHDAEPELHLPTSTVIMPWGSDLHRESTATLLRDAGLVWFTGTLGEQKDKYLRFEGAAGTLLAPMVVAQAAGARGIYRKVRAAAKQRRPLIVLTELRDTDDVVVLESVASALIRTAKRGTDVDWPSLTDCLSEAGEAGEADHALPADPSHRASWIEAWRLRRAGEDREERIRSILRRFAPQRCGQCETEPQESTEREERIVIASMLGTAWLAEDNASASFAEGRLNAIAGPAGEYSFPMPVRSYMTVESGRRAVENVFQTDSAFSYEAPRIRGLQESLSSRAVGQEERGTVSLEYFYIDGFSCLLVNVALRHGGNPGEAPVLTYAPFEIPLFPLFRGDHVVATSLYPDGSSASLTLDSRERTAELAGTGFFFSPAIAGLPVTVDRTEPPYLMIAFPDSRESCTDILPVQIRRHERGWVLYANPRGSYRPFRRSALAGTQERFSMMLTVTSRLRIPTVPADAKAALYASSVAPAAG